MPADINIATTLTRLIQEAMAITAGCLSAVGALFAASKALVLSACPIGWWSIPALFPMQ